MKKLLYIFIFSALTISAYGQNIAESPAKLSLSTRKFLKEFEQAGKLPEGYIYRTHANGAVYVSSMVKISDVGLAETGLAAIEAEIGTKAGDIWTVRVPAGNVPEFVKVKGISYIQLDEPVFPNLDAARKSTRVDSVHEGINLPMKYSGKDVVMGIIDFGFDYTHPAFYDTSGTKYRIKRVWELDTNGIPPTGYSYGNEITDATAMQARGTDNNVQMHGSGVAGLAAGSGFGGAPNGKHRGIAYESDLVFVGVRRDSIGKQWMQGGFADFVDGISYIFNYAAAQSKPAVVNISWGSQSGAHDGTSLFNQACDNLSGKGKIIVMSAGNDGQEKIHLTKQFTASDSTLSTFLTFSPAVYKRTWVDIWGEAGQDICMAVNLFHNGIPSVSTGSICIDDNTHTINIIGSNGLDTCFVEFITSEAELNGKRRITADIYNKSQDTLGFTVTAQPGKLHIWNEYYYYGYKYQYTSEFDSLRQNWANSGNTSYTVSDMGSAQSVLLVGAYTSKNRYNTITGQLVTYSGYTYPGQLTPFSSRGPMADGRIKPDFVAPGFTIASATNSFNVEYTPAGANKNSLVFEYIHPVSGKKYYMSEFTGTSASAPIASGIVALLLQVKPDLTPGQVRQILTETAIQDVQTGAIPATGNNNWGHGKVNAYQAIKRAIQISGTPNLFFEQAGFVLYPNPNNGAFTLGYASAADETMQVEIYNTVGALVAQEAWDVTAGDNEKAFDFSTLSQGIYMVKINGRQGTVTLRTVVNHN